MSKFEMTYFGELKNKCTIQFVLSDTQKEGPYGSNYFHLH